MHRFLTSRLPAAASLLLGLLALPPDSRAQGIPDYELPPIHYSTATPADRLARLDESWSVSRPRGTEADLLRWLLAELQIPVESQVLVFSRTSLQRDLIHPRQPRAIYFSDDIYIGWVPGGLIEAAVTDPHLGMVFYRLDARRQDRPLHFVRDADCLSCHGGSMTRHWPGLMVRSVFPDARGEPITSAGSVLVGHDTPFEKRWGGWYVTGRHGQARHLGNLFAKPAPGGAEVDTDAGANRSSLEDFFATARYPRPDSDIVALMVLEHQVVMHNRLSEGALRVRRWSHYQRQLQFELGEPVSDIPVGTALRVVQGETERIVDALLYHGEIRLPEGGIRGAGDFERAFAASRRPDARGRSLRDFDLDTRLFRWRCSFLIHSEAFAALPRELKSSVLRRLDDILAAHAPPDRYAYLDDDERRAIRGILLETHPEFAAAVRGP